LARVTKSPASFDPQKLLTFQGRWMHQLPCQEKAVLCLPYLQAAGLISQSPDAQMLEQIAQVVAAADDRIKIAGDILDFDDFFLPDSQLTYDEAAFEKRMRQDPAAVENLKKFRLQLASLESFDAASCEACLKTFVESAGIKFNQIIHALRVSVTGKAVGFGMFDCLAILGQERCLARIDRALDRLH
jgi:glutamyl-tRNA synthetase